MIAERQLSGHDRGLGHHGGRKVDVGGRRRSGMAGLSGGGSCCDGWGCPGNLEPGPKPPDDPNEKANGLFGLNLDANGSGKPSLCGFDPGKL